MAWPRGGPWRWQQADPMSSSGIPIPLVAAALTAAVSIFLWVANAWLTARRETINRQRDTFSKAYAACVAYQEFPYVIRRRGSDVEQERNRISSELRSVQQDLAYYSAWIATESAHVGQAYEALVAALRQVAGRYMRDAWTRPPTSSDVSVNITDIDMSSLEDPKRAYIAAVREHLSLIPGWISRASSVLRPGLGRGRPSRPRAHRKT